MRVFTVKGFDNMVRDMILQTEDFDKIIEISDRNPGSRTVLAHVSGTKGNLSRYALGVFRYNLNTEDWEFSIGSYKVGERIIPVCYGYYGNINSREISIG